MVKIWSELPGARRQEQLADIATVIWVVFWGRLVWLLYELLASFAGAGRSIRDGGTGLTQAGQDLGDRCATCRSGGCRPRWDRLPARAAAFEFGSEFDIRPIVAAAIALLFALVTLVPWLNRYLPWRWTRLRFVRAAHQALRRPTGMSALEIEQILAMRAVMRLDYPTLLEFTPDPLGDWSSGRHDRLAQAELASVGLRRPRAEVSGA
jgi:hypothetical protein